ncbi:dienelactone hydrolase family protein [Marispirochaeta aestuarii]|uniref:dienelactone hydrolase family protein n=1 Tax=Marispirochaeta aestuarii TaxID=1963862 RepID=UPI0029C95281|nr:dienelactone hydrolase family protein [Marispirochaeta aestuarii]
MKFKWVLIVLSFVFLLTGLTAEGAQDMDMDRESVIYTEEISYTVDGQRLVGLLAYDESVKESRPGILVVHEWQGINDYAKKRAVDLAKEGYVAFALDMYGDGKEIPREEARDMSGRIGTDYPLVQKRFNAALDILKEVEYTDPDKLGAIGYCFGGGIVLNMARLGTDIDGVVGFHSSINTGLNAEKGDIKTKILAIQGDQDPAAPREKQEAFIQEMTEAEADFTYIIYGNLPAHNFTNPSGSSYYEDEANMAWASMLVFFDSLF